MKSRAWWMVLVLAGCSESVGTTEQPIVNPVTPYVGPSVFFLSSFPALVAHGRLPEGAYSDTARAAAHQAHFTDGVDLAGAVPLDDASDSGKRNTWANDLVKLIDGDYLQSPALAAHVADALDRANPRLGELSLGTLTLAADLLDVIPGFTHGDPQLTQTFMTWTAPRARWLDSRWASPPAPAPRFPETHYHYPTPVGLTEAPERAARLYCAAREVARHQTSGSLGEQVLLPVSVLGQNLDIGVFEASAFVNEPVKSTGADDGAQAFDVPLALGVQITPIRNITPTLPELRYPVVLTAADTEVVNDVGRDVIYEDRVCHGPFGICVPVIRPDFRYRYKTVSHVDAATSAGAWFRGNGTFPLFWAGPLMVTFTVDVGASVGHPIPRTDTFAALPAHDVLLDDRVLAIGAAPVGWPSTIRGGQASPPYLDGYWRNPQSYVPGSAATLAFQVHSVDNDTHVDTTDATIALAATDPLRQRLVTDDDHHLSPTSELALAGTIKADIGFHAGPATLTISASGTVLGVAGIAHDIRDAVYAVFNGFSFQPATALTITPTTYADANLKILVSFDLVIPLIVHTIRVHYDFIDSDFPIGSVSKPWDESHRLRIGTDSTIGDATFAPQVDSHIGSETFASFPPSTPDVATCLADTTEVPAPPPPCDSHQPDGSPARVESCFYLAASPRFDPCANIPVVTDTSPPADQCLAAELQYVCSDVSQEQAFGTQFVIAHVMKLDPAHKDEDSADLAAIANIVDKCAAADGDSFPTTDADVSAWFAARFKIAPCDAAATLHAPTDVVSPSGSSPVGPGSCH